MVQNKGFIFKSAPEAFPIPGKDLVVEVQEFDIDQSPPEGGLITKNYYASLDPYLRGRMRAPEVKSYSPAFTLGKPITTNQIAKVLKSDNEKFKPGDIIRAHLPVQEYSAVPSVLANMAEKVVNPYELDLKYFIGAMGMPGLTAYSSLYAIGKPKKGETIFISAASGAVGQIVGQLAKVEGLRVIGSVGTDEKLTYILEELGFDGGFNYKKESAASALARLAPDGVDIYYENVGGEQLEAALQAMNNWGRIVACGMISQYNKPPAESYGVKSMVLMVSKRLTMTGFIVGDANMGPLYVKERDERMGKWIKDGEFKVLQSLTKGIDNASEAFVGMLKGENFGKAVLVIAELEDSD